MVSYRQSNELHLPSVLLVVNSSRFAMDEECHPCQVPVITEEIKWIFLDLTSGYHFENLLK